jgi:hypothetical protein
MGDPPPNPTATESRPERPNQGATDGHDPATTAGRGELPRSGSPTGDADGHKGDAGDKRGKCDLTAAIAAVRGQERQIVADVAGFARDQAQRLPDGPRELMDQVVNRMEQFANAEANIATNDALAAAGLVVGWMNVAEGIQHIERHGPPGSILSLAHEHGIATVNVGGVTLPTKLLESVGGDRVARAVEDYGRTIGVHVGNPLRESREQARHEQHDADIRFARWSGAPSGGPRPDLPHAALGATLATLEGQLRTAPGATVVTQAPQFLNHLANGRIVEAFSLVPPMTMDAWGVHGAAGALRGAVGAGAAGVGAASESAGARTGSAVRPPSAAPVDAVAAPSPEPPAVGSPPHPDLPPSPVAPSGAAATELPQAGGTPLRGGTIEAPYPAAPGAPGHAESPTTSPMSGPGRTIGPPRSGEPPPTSAEPLRANAGDGQDSSGRPGQAAGSGGTPPGGGGPDDPGGGGGPPRPPGGGSGPPPGEGPGGNTAPGRETIDDMIHGIGGADRVVIDNLLDRANAAWARGEPVTPELVRQWAAELGAAPADTIPNAATPQESGASQSPPEASPPGNEPGGPAGQPGEPVDGTPADPTGDLGQYLDGLEPRAQDLLIRRVAAAAERGQQITPQWLQGEVAVARQWAATLAPEPPGTAVNTEAARARVEAMQAGQTPETIFRSRNAEAHAREYWNTTGTTGDVPPGYVGESGHLRVYTETSPTVGDRVPDQVPVTDDMLQRHLNGDPIP